METKATWRRACALWIVTVALSLGACGAEVRVEPSSPRSPPAAPAPPPIADAPAAPARPQDEEGVAVAIVLDTSGSMKESVRNARGEKEPKHRIAERAMEGILARLETAAAGPASGGRPRRIDAALYVFEGTDVRTASKMAPLDAKKLRAVVSRLGTPQADTPLGSALKRAGTDLLATPLRHRHVLVVTDGKNTRPPDPADAMGGIVELARERETPVGVHFVAFDVDAAVFNGVKGRGATVVSASDEAQLAERLGWILETKILLEDEEPPAGR